MESSEEIQLLRKEHRQFKFLFENSEKRRIKEEQLHKEKIAKLLEATATYASQMESREKELLVEIGQLKSQNKKYQDGIQKIEEKIGDLGQLRREKIQDSKTIKQLEDDVILLQRENQQYKEMETKLNLLKRENNRYIKEFILLNSELELLKQEKQKFEENELKLEKEREQSHRDEKTILKLEKTNESLRKDNAELLEVISNYDEIAFLGTIGNLIETARKKVLLCSGYDVEGKITTTWGEFQDSVSEDDEELTVEEIFDMDEVSWERINVLYTTRNRVIHRTVTLNTIIRAIQNIPEKYKYLQPDLYKLYDAVLIDKPC
jgi:hypothetical protein